MFQLISTGSLLTRHWMESPIRARHRFLLLMIYKLYINSNKCHHWIKNTISLIIFCRPLIPSILGPPAVMPVRHVIHIALPWWVHSLWDLAVRYQHARILLQDIHFLLLRCPVPDSDLAWYERGSQNRWHHGVKWRNSHCHHRPYYYHKGVACFIWQEENTDDYILTYVI